MLVLHLQTTCSDSFILYVSRPILYYRPVETSLKWICPYWLVSLSCHDSTSVSRSTSTINTEIRDSHTSFTLIRTILLCLSNALIRARSFRLFRRLMRTWSWFCTACWRTLSGPFRNSNSSSSASSASESSPFGRVARSAMMVVRKEFGFNGSTLQTELESRKC